MNKNKRDRILYKTAYFIAIYIVGGALLAGYEKILYPDQFALAVFRYNLLPDVLVNITALYLTWLETLCGIILICIPRFRRAALWIVLLLLVFLTGGIIINILRGTQHTCGCFSLSPNARPMDWFTVLRNIGLIALSSSALFSRRRIR